MAFYQDSSMDDDFTIDCLPLDCIVCICEFLPVNDLGRFGRVCKFFYEASLVGFLWRRHCLSRWTFCDVQQISAGPQRWRRYFLARRRVEASMERGRPGKDYKVKTLRGHENDVISAYVIGGGRMNWEKPHPPLIISLSQDRNVKAWDVTQGKPVWSLADQGTTAIAVNSSTMELATGAIDGMVTLWDCEQWATKRSFKTELGGQVLALKFGTLKPSKQLLMVHVAGGGLDRADQLEIWQLPPAQDPSSVAVTQDEVPKLLLELWAPSHKGVDLQLSSTGLLAVPGRAGDVHIWDLTESLPDSAPRPLPPLLTVDTQHPVSNVQWTSPGVLLTREGSKISYWDINSKLDTQMGLRPSRSTTTMYSATKELLYDCHVTAMAIVNDKIVVGAASGEVCVYDGSSKGGRPHAFQTAVQRFSDHKGAVTDIYADSFRVLTCSRDFSVRVYCWKKDGDKVSLESKYTLLGGSVAHKTHDGFNALLCETSSFVGIAGNQLKCYTFTSPPLAEQPVLNIT